MTSVPRGERRHVLLALHGSDRIAIVNRAEGACSVRSMPAAGPYNERRKPQSLGVALLCFSNRRSSTKPGLPHGPQRGRWWSRVLEGAGWFAPGSFGMMEPADTSDRRGEGALVEDESLERNKAVVRRWIELWNERGADGVDEVFAADFRDAQLEQRLVAPLTLELFKESLRALEAAIGHARFEERELLAEGDRVMVRWTMHATHQGPFWGLQPTGRRFALDGVNVFRVENGRIAERLSYVDAASLLAQLG